MKALVLSGGSVKGAFQAGAIKSILTKGFIPQIIYGVSVGSLNGSWITNEAGKSRSRQETPDWNMIASQLCEFWIHNITRPTDIIKKRVL